MITIGYCQLQGPSLFLLLLFFVLPSCSNKRLCSASRVIVIDANVQGEACVGVDGSIGGCDDTAVASSSNSVVPPSLFEFGEDMGVEQTLNSGNTEAQEILQKARFYLQQSAVFRDEKYQPIRDQCKNKHRLCAFWATLGECQKNPLYMNRTCAPACQACEYLLLEVRCAFDVNSATDAWYPGDLDKTFGRIITHPEFTQYEPTILSRPPTLSDDPNDTVVSSVGSGPWLITMENLVSPEEARVLIELGEEQGYQRSKEVGTTLADGNVEANAIEGRTSANAWCQNTCYNHVIAKALMKRIEIISGTAEANSDYLQILRYEPGQFYHTHHDYKAFHRQRPMGVRLLTILIYLSDVEEGGETNFPELNLTVSPKVGRAVIWPSVLNEDPNSPDMRTSHQSLPVVKGVKYAINAWIHQRDMKAANARACS